VPCGIPHAAEIHLHTRCTFILIGSPCGTPQEHFHHQRIRGFRSISNVHPFQIRRHRLRATLLQLSSLPDMALPSQSNPPPTFIPSSYGVTLSEQPSTNFQPFQIWRYPLRATLLHLWPHLHLTSASLAALASNAPQDFISRTLSTPKLVASPACLCFESTPSFPFYIPKSAFTWVEASLRRTIHPSRT
jgi:hypothetical protein